METKEKNIEKINIYIKENIIKNLLNRKDFSEFVHFNEATYSFDINFKFIMRESIHIIKLYNEKENKMLIETQDEIKERIIETNYYLTQALINKNKLEVEKQKAIIDYLIKEYLKK
jgi:hypothetical protein